MRNNLPNLIRKYLETTGKTQKQLAQESGLDQATLSRLIHSDRRNLNLEIAEVLQPVLGFQPHELVIAVENGD